MPVVTRANRVWVALGAILLAFALPYAARGGFTASGAAAGKQVGIAPGPAHAIATVSLGHARTLPASLPALPRPRPAPARPAPRRARTVVTAPRRTAPAPTPAPVVVNPTPPAAQAPPPASAPAPRPAPAPKQFSSSG